MVKNTVGGKKGKMLSKKQHSAVDSHFPISTCPQEIYVCVTKIFGGGVFEVTDQHNHVYKAFLRGKMRGSNKRHNMVSLFSILLVGIRADFSDKSSVDILFVYDPSHIQSLSISSHFPNSLLSFANNHGSNKIHDDSLLFSDINTDFTINHSIEQKLDADDFTDTDFDFDNI
jgi:hypothetical protein